MHVVYSPWLVMLINKHVLRYVDVFGGDAESIGMQDIYSVSLFLRRAHSSMPTNATLSTLEIAEQ